MAQRDQVLGLFGASPEQVMARIRREQSQEILQQQDPFMRAGSAIGTGLARLFGGEPAEVTQQRELYKTLEGVNFESPEQMRQAAVTLKSQFPDKALQLLTMADAFQTSAQTRETARAEQQAAERKIEVDEAEIASARVLGVGKEVIKGATPESVASATNYLATIENPTTADRNKARSLLASKKTGTGSSTPETLKSFLGFDPAVAGLKASPETIILANEARLTPLEGETPTEHKIRVGRLITHRNEQDLSRFININASQYTTESQKQAGVAYNQGPQANESVIDFRNRLIGLLKPVDDTTYADTNVLSPEGKPIRGRKVNGRLQIIDDNTGQFVDAPPNYLLISDTIDPEGKVTVDGLKTSKFILTNNPEYAKLSTFFGLVDDPAKQDALISEFARLRTNRRFANVGNESIAKEAALNLFDPASLVEVLLDGKTYIVDNRDRNNPVTLREKL
jgi:hypothetical protein